MKPCALISQTQSSHLLSHLLEGSRRERIFLTGWTNTARSRECAYLEVWNKQGRCHKSLEKIEWCYHILNSGHCGGMADSHALSLVASQICVTDRAHTHNSRLNIGLLVFSCQELSRHGRFYLLKKKKYFTINTTTNTLFKHGPHVPDI